MTKRFAGKTVHPFTDADSLPDTCLRSNYIIVLLEDVYGIPSESQKVETATRSAGTNLGAKDGGVTILFLAGHNSSGVSRRGGRVDKGSGD